MSIVEGGVRDLSGNVIVFIYKQEHPTYVPIMEILTRGMESVNNMSLVLYNMSEYCDEPEEIKQFNITHIPVILFLSNGKVFKRIEGYYPDTVKYTLNFLSDNDMEEIVNSGLNPSQENNISKLILSSKTKYLVFIKGTPESPQCGFTREVVNIMKQRNVEVDYIDINSEESTRNNIREDMKKFVNWKTFPMIFESTKFIGGLDLLKKQWNLK